MDTEEYQALRFGRVGQDSACEPPGWQWREGESACERLQQITVITDLEVERLM